jgi:MFS family permease
VVIVALERSNNNNNNSSAEASTKISRHAWQVTAILSSAATMVMYAETMLIPAIPGLIKDFDISYSTSSWILTTYLVAAAVMTPISGKLSDIYGKKKILLIIMMIYTASVSLGGFADSISFLLVVRAIQGIGLSMFPIAFSIVRDLFPRQKIALGQGVISSMFASGAVIGLAVGSIIVQQYGWHATFYSLIPIAVMLTVIIWKFIHFEEEEEEEKEKEYKATQIQEHQQKKEITTRTVENLEGADVGSVRQDNYLDKNKNILSSSVTETAPRLDVKGAITLSLTITSLLLAITFLEPGSVPESETIILVPIFLASGIASLVVFVIIEKRVKSPLLNLNLFLDKTILRGNILILIVGFSMFTVFQTIPVIVENPEPVGFGQDAISAARAQLPFAIILVVFGPTSGFIISKLGSRMPIIAGTSISTAAFFALYFLHSMELSLSASLALLAVGISLINVGGQNLIILSTPRQYSGISLGMTMLMRIVGSAIAPVVAAMFLESYQYSVASGGGTGGAAIIEYYPSAESYNMIFLTSGLLTLFCVGLALTLARTTPKCQKHLPKEQGEMRGTIVDRIKHEIMSWPNVTSQPQSFGGVDFRVGGKEMGHLHGENLVDLPLRPNDFLANSYTENKLDRVLKQWDEKAQESVPPHDAYPESKWTNYWIKDEEDVPRVVALFRLQYDRLTKKK